MARNKSSYDLGLAAARHQGIRTGLVKTIDVSLDTNFVGLNESTLDALRAKSTDELRKIALAWPNAQSLAELGR